MNIDVAGLISTIFIVIFYSLSWFFVSFPSTIFLPSLVLIVHFMWFHCFSSQHINYPSAFLSHFFFLPPFLSPSLLLLFPLPLFFTLSFVSGCPWVCSTYFHEFQSSFKLYYLISLVVHIPYFFLPVLNNIPVIP